MQEPAGLAGAVAPAIGAQPPFHWSQQHQVPARPQRRTKAVGGAPLEFSSACGGSGASSPGRRARQLCMPSLWVWHIGEMAGRAREGACKWLGPRACACGRAPRPLPLAPVPSQAGASSRPQRCAGRVVSRDPQVAPPQLDVPAGAADAGRQS